jgi:hypothetical protein
MRITNDDVFNPHPVFGSQPHLFHGDDVPDATSKFTNKGVGSVYYCHLATGHFRRYVKVKADSLGGDYKCEVGVISQRLTTVTMTDGGSTALTQSLAADIPLGARALGTTVQDVTGFAGDTTAVIIVGDGTDTDRYNTGTPSVFATIAAVDMGVPSGTIFHSAAKTPVVTITSTADATSVKSNGSGALTVHLSYAM